MNVNPFTVNGNIDNGANLLGVDGAGNTVITGVIGCGAVASGGLVKDGGGMLTLTGNNLYTGPTTIRAGTLALSGSGSIANTSGIALNGGSLVLTNVNGTEGTLTRISSTTPITSHGGAITYTNAPGYNYAQTLNLSLTSGMTTITSSTEVGSGNTSVLTIGTGGPLRPAGSTATVNFQGSNLGVNGLQNSIQIAGMSPTPPNQIIGPWASIGSGYWGTGAYYAVYTANGIAALSPAQDTTDSGWSTVWSSTSNYGTWGLSLTAPRCINTLSCGTSIDLGNFSLSTYGIQQYAYGLGVVASGNGYLTTPVGGDNTLYLSGACSISAPIRDNGSPVTVVVGGGPGSTGVTFGNAANTYSGGTIIDSGVASGNFGTGKIVMAGGALSGGGDFSSRLVMLDGVNAIFSGYYGVGVYASPIGNNTTAGLIINFSDGSLILTSTANTFSGPVWIQSGELRVASLADSGVGSNGTGTITIGQLGSAGQLTYTGIGATLTRAVDMAGTSGGATIESDGSGPLVFSSNFTASGCANKTLCLQGSNTGNNTIAGTIADNNPGNTTSVTKDGWGNWVLSNTANPYTGSLTVRLGTLSVLSLADSGVGSNGTGNIVLGGEGGTAILQYLGTPNVTLSSRGISLGDNGGNMGIDSSGIGTLTVSGSFGGYGAGAKRLLLQGSNTGNNTIAAAIGETDPSQNTGLTKSGGGTWVLSNTANTFTGALSVQQGTLIVFSLADSGPGSNGTGNIWLGNSTTTGTLQYVGSNNVVLASRSIGLAGTSGGGVVDVSGPGSLTINGDLAAPGPGAKTLVLQGTNTGNNVFGGAIVDYNSANPTSLVKAGPGNWVLAAANTFSGDTRVTAGLLTLANPLALQNSSLDLNAADSGSLSFGTMAAATFGGLKGTRNLDLDNSLAAAVALSVGGNNANTTFSGALSGEGSLAKLGGGVLLLAGANTYAGETDVGGGILQLGTTGALPGGTALTVDAGGTLDLNGFSFATPAINGSGVVALGNANLSISSTSDTTLAVQVTGPGSLGKPLGGTLTLTDNNDYAGPTTVSAGTLQIGNGGTSGAIAGNVTNNAMVAFNRADTYGFAGNISGSGGLANIGPGTLVLTGSNTYGGATNIAAGTVRLGGVSALPSGTALTIAGGATLDLNGIGYTTASIGGIGAITLGGATLTVNNVSDTVLAVQIGGPGGLTKSGSGNLTVTGNNSYNGGTTIAGGLLRLGGPGALPGGTSITINGTLDLNTFDATVSGLAGSGLIDKSAPGSNTLTVGSNDASGGFAGTIQNSGGVLALTKIGNGTVDLTAAATTYAGPTTIYAGNLLAGNLANTSVVNVNAGVLSLTACNPAAPLNVAYGAASYVSGTGLSLATVNNAGSVYFTGSSGTITLAGLVGAGASNFSAGASFPALWGGQAYIAGPAAITSVYGGWLTANNTASIGSISGGTANLYGEAAIGTASGGTIYVYRPTSIGTLGNATVNLGGGTVLSVLGGNQGIGGAIAGPGSLSKDGGGTLVLGGNTTYSGGTTITTGTLLLANSAAIGTAGLTVGASGTLDLNRYSLTLPAIGGPAGGRITDNSSRGSAPTVLTVNTSSGDSLYGGAIGLGVNGQDIALVKTGNGTLTLAGSSGYSGGTTINQGTLNVTGTLGGGGNVVVGAGATLTGSGLVRGNVSGGAASIITASGNLVVGDSTSYTGFNYSGTLVIGANAITLGSKGFSNLGSLTTISGGTLTAPNGITVPLGGNLVGSGAVNGKIAAGYGSTINATGNLTLGDSTSPVGFVSDGELYTNANSVTLLSNNAANNKNAVVLGSLTEIAGGSLIAPNGIVLDTGNNLVTTDAGGTVSDGTASRFLNLGNVQGPSSASSNWLTFNMLFKGGTGQTSGRIAFLGGFATGDSPGVNYQYGATQLGGSGTEFDIDGTTPGNADNNYGQLNILTDPNDPNNHGDLVLATGTSFNIVDWNGFVPTPGETFTVLTWDGTLSGTAALAVDPAFAADGIQFVPEWNSNSLVIEAVPEPSTLALLCAGAIGLVGYGLRWRRSARRAAQPESQDDAPAILSLPLHSSHQADVARRAA